jgi:hypothetical protein
VDVDVQTCPGHKIKGICAKMNARDITKYDNIIMYAGGNDAASGSSPSSWYSDLKAAVQSTKNGQKMYLCTACPRRDVDVGPLNDTIKQLGMDVGVEIIDCHQAFVFKNGRISQDLFNRDGIHLSSKGSSTLVQTINQHKTITKNRETRWKQPRSYNASHALDNYSDQSGRINYTQTRTSNYNANQRRPVRHISEDQGNYFRFGVPHSYRNDRPPPSPRSHHTEISGHVHNVRGDHFRSGSRNYSEGHGGRSIFPTRRPARQHVEMNRETSGGRDVYFRDPSYRSSVQRGSRDPYSTGRSHAGSYQPKHRTF